MFAFPNNLFNEHHSRPFSTMYKCYSISMLPGNERSDVEKGGKIIMPPSALDQLTRMNISYPMLFKLTNPRTNRISHCGVLEFIADEGKVYMPYWMMRNLLLDEGAMVRVESANDLKVATFSKFQPQSMDFLDITDPKAVLENALRNFACLTAGDVIALDYNSHTYEMCVLETRPGNAVSIIECDMSVDFAPPVGYQEPDRPNGHHNGSSGDHEGMEEEEEEEVVSFPGQGSRLDGKNKVGEVTKTKVARGPLRRGQPDYNYKFGQLRFIRTAKPAAQVIEDQTTSLFEAFGGSGQTLKKRPGVQ